MREMGRSLHLPRCGGFRCFTRLARTTPYAFCSAWPIKVARRRIESCGGTTGSRNDSHRNAFTCSKDFLESAPRSQTDCCCHFGSVERVITADAATLTEVRGLGPKKAARIRDLVV